MPLRRGAQAGLRVSEDGQQALAVLHTFDSPLPAEVRVILPAGEGWQVYGTFPASSNPPVIEGNVLKFVPGGPFTGQVVLVNR